MNSLNIREATEEDHIHLREWLMEPGVLQWFPMDSEKEVEDAAKIWTFYSRWKSCFIAEIDSVPCGSVLLNLTKFEKVQHQCLLSIIVSEKYRNLGIGTKLLDFIEKTAVEKFKIELLHLEVYENNPAQRLYERAGYKIYGHHPKFLKEGSVYKSKILMQKWLIQH